MRKIALLVLAAGLGLAGSASAADLAPVYRKAPIAPTWTWEGGYIGLYIGGAGGTDVRTTIPTTPVPTTQSYALDSSVIGGYTSGRNWLVAPNWLLGYESETGYIKLRGTTVFPVAANANATADVGSLYSVWAARFGYVADKSLFYAKGGVLLTRLDSGENQVAPPLGLVSGHKYSVGYAAGGGWEYAFDPKWSVKAEYLYLGLDKTISFGPTPATTASTHFEGIHTGKIGLNYKWDWLSLLR